MLLLNCTYSIPSLLIEVFRFLHHQVSIVYYVLYCVSGLSTIFVFLVDT